MVTREIKLFQNNFEIICLFQNNFEIISVFCFTCEIISAAEIISKLFQ